jgi:hypothetical protein
MGFLCAQFGLRGAWIEDHVLDLHKYTPGWAFLKEGGGFMVPTVSGVPVWPKIRARLRSVEPYQIWPLPLSVFSYLARAYAQHARATGQPADSPGQG